MKKLKSIILSCLFLLSSTLATKAIEEKDWSEQQKYFSTFIERTCCFTNNCCWEIQSNEVTDLGNDEYKINSTGQVISRRDYSPDGKFYRCACDPVDIDGKTHWIKHQGAHTRCLYVPFRGF